MLTPQWGISYHQWRLIARQSAMLARRPAQRERGSKCDISIFLGRAASRNRPTYRALPGLPTPLSSISRKFASLGWLLLAAGAAPHAPHSREGPVVYIVLGRI
jgi:hypothetical protein